jgi:Skp family chaperone for outer membrane proteins
VRRSVLVATLVACLSLVSLGSLQAQGTSAPTPQRATVVVIDLDAVFKAHNRFKQAVDIMKKDVAEFENYISNQQALIRKKTEEIKQYNPGTPNYKQLEEQAAQMTSKLQVEIQLKRRDFMEREARLYYNVYTEVKGLVARFANEQGISLVLRYNSAEIDPADRNSVMMGVHSTVVFQRNLDITSWIIQKANEGSAPPPVDPRAVRPQLPPRSSR